MTEMTPRWAFPLIAPGQAQKEMTHNEALAQLDIVVAASAIACGEVTPPASPAPGQAWIIGTGAAGDWAGQDGAIAGWTDGGWRFVAPRPGMLVWVEALARYARFSGVDGWIIGAPLGPPQSPVPEPSGGAIVDLEARSAIVAILARLQQVGIVEMP